MSITITIQQEASPNATVTYAALASGSGKYALAFDPRASRRDLRRFRVPGISGSYVIDGGDMGAQPVMMVRYVYPENTAMSNYLSDVTAFDSEPWKITSSGAEFEGCHLSSTRIVSYRGDGTNAIVDAELVFSEDDPA